LGFLPISNYSSDLGLTLGALAQVFDYGHQQNQPFDGLLTLQVSNSSRGAWEVFFSYERTKIGTFSLRSYSSLILSDNKFQPYYGLGNLSVYNSSLQRQGFYYYEQQDYEFENSLRKYFTNLHFDLETGVTLAWNNAQVDQISGSQFQNDFGINPSQLFYTKPYLRAIYEGRDSEFNPSQGNYALAGLTIAPDFLGQTSTWSRLDLDLRHYEPTSDDTPLLEKARLGSVGTLRGLPFNRYVANDSLTLRTELRSVIIRETVFGLPLKLGTGIFVDSGKIASNFASIFDNSIHYAYGFSLFGSYFTDDFLGTADFGFSEGLVAFYFRLGHAF